MAKLILGKSWSNASALQREQFIEQFKVQLLQAYSHVFFEHEDKEIVYLPAEQPSKPNVVTVKVEVRSNSGRPPLPIHYRMYNKDNAWKAIDVSIDGVSLVLTYRGAFAATVKKGGLDLLIRQLSEKNARGVAGSTARQGK